MIAVLVWISGEKKIKKNLKISLVVKEKGLYICSRLQSKQVHTHILKRDPRVGVYIRRGSTPFISTSNPLDVPSGICLRGQMGNVH